MDTNLNMLPCLYFSSRDDGTLSEVNEPLCKNLGYSREELLGKKIETIFTVATRIFQQTHLFPLLKMQGHAEEIYISLRAKDGEEVPALINAERKELQQEMLTSYAGIIVHQRTKFEDELVAAKKAAETALHQNTALLHAKQDLQKHSEQLDQQMRMVSKQNEELRQFNHVVTHDLQEPLRKLFLFTERLLETDDRVSEKKMVEKIRLVSGQMRTIFSGLQQYIWLT